MKKQDITINSPLINSVHIDKKNKTKPIPLIDSTNYNSFIERNFYKKQEVHDFQPPLDIVDGAARVMDPLFDGINTGKHWCGKFLKDYFPIDW